MRRLSSPAQVQLQGGRPVRVSWSSDSGGRAAHYARRRAAGPAGPARAGSVARVSRVVDEWRIATRWWERELQRDYYLVEVDGGHHMELYCEAGRWYVTGIED